MRRLIVVPFLLASVSLVHAPAARAEGLGGGFIEFLVTGGQMQQRQPDAQPRRQQQRFAIEPQRRVVRADPDAGVSTEPRPLRPMPSSETASLAPRKPKRVIPPEFLPQVVDYGGGERPGTIVVDTNDRFLYLVKPDGKAKRYGVGVGREGFEWSGTKKVTRKAEWPDWRPPAEMRKRRPDLPAFMEGGPDNPLGARALYLGSSLYRIHGSNEPHSIGQAVSSGCIRMRNEDVIDLYNQVRVGATVIVR